MYNNNLNSPIVRLVEGEERRNVSDNRLGTLTQNWGETEPNRIVTSLVLKAMSNDNLTLCHDEFCESQSSTTDHQEHKIY
ncbi:hypothetical protein TNCV_622971 [Trichonephila clavipes]|nr:hypothetical protein TNCV_622971 [Trichonephila clavipes]